MANIESTSEGLRELALFAGAGGGILGGKLLGWRTVCAVERDAYAASVLVARQNDGCLSPFPVWDDVCTFDGKPWRGRVDVVSGGFPCQDISTAGKGAGITGARSGLWREMARIIGEVGPRFVLVENSPALTSRGLGTVLGDLAELGFDAEWGVLGAVHAGAPHRRNRIWIVGRHPERELADADVRRCLHGPAEIVAAETELHAQRELVPIGADVANANGNISESKHGGAIEEQGGNQNGSVFPFGSGEMADASSFRQSGQRASWYACDPAEKENRETNRAWAKRVGQIWGVESQLGRVAHGVANRVDRLRCLGNGQVPSVVKLAWETLTS